MEATEMNAESGKSSDAMLDLRVVTEALNASVDDAEMRIKLDLAGINLPVVQLKKIYTEQVAKKWPKFFECFRDPDTDLFDFEKFKTGKLAKSFSPLECKPKLPWEITVDGVTLQLKVAINSTEDKIIRINPGIFSELGSTHGIDGELECVRMALLDLAGMSVGFNVNKQ